MKSLRFAFAAMAIFLVLVSLSGCKKIIEKYFPGHGGGHHHEKECRIAKTFDVYEGDTLEYRFYYDGAGRPDSIVPQPQWPNYPTFYQYFHYNDQNRLIGRTLLDAARAPFADHYYRYTGNKITYDSAYTHYDRRASVAVYTYDAAGRIVQDSSYVVGGPGQPRVINYTYDSEGNLVIPRPNNTTGVYDEETSFISSNPIWQFLSRDYSVNNPAIVTGYNNQGLPVAFNNYLFFILHSYVSLGDASFVAVRQIEWACFKND